MGRRKANASTGEDTAIWRDIHGGLSTLAGIQTRLIPAVDAANCVLAESFGEDEAVGFHLLRERIEKALQTVRLVTDEEEKVLNGCIEKLSILMALRDAPPEISQSGGRQTKKRRLDNSPTRSPSIQNAGTFDASSRRSSPVAMPSSAASASAPQTAPTSTTSPHAAPTHNPLSITLTLGKRGTSSSRGASRSSTPVPSSSGPEGTTSVPVGGLARSGSSAQFRSSAVPVRTDRKMIRKDQLPLLPGRLVTFKRPRKGEVAGEEWIMAKVVKCLAGDKNRYEVQDIDTPEDGGPPMTFNTTLKSLIPLPIADQPDTYPSLALAAGTSVLALYPDTTSFYRGKIKSGPSDKGRKYKVYFEEDDDADGKPTAKPVVMEYVVPLPG